jgi:hypothetical protein
LPCFPSLPSFARRAQYIIAEAEVPDAESGGDMRRSMNTGFRSVAGFIFGGNSARESVAMTSPVRTERVEGAKKKGESIAMTSPVRTERSPGGGAFRVSFVMPRKYGNTLDALPAPKDARVRLREVPAHVAAAVSFTGGVADAGAMERWAETLARELEQAGLTPEGPPQLYNYYPPFAPNWLRHTEVLYRIKERAEEVEAGAAKAAQAAAAQARA